MRKIVRPAGLGLALWGVALLGAVQLGRAQEEKPATPERGSLVEDRAARKLLEAGDARLDADEATKAVEVWQSVIERYPRSKVRYEAHMRLGNYLLNRERAYDRARTHFEAAAAEENRDEAQRAEATLNMGVCFFEAANYGRSFKIMRDVIEQFPVSKQVNQAYYYIGLGHFRLGHYSRAIQALEKVGTAMGAEDEDTGPKAERVEAGKRLFVKIEDADLAVLDIDQTVKVLCETVDGDKETVECYPVGRNVRIVLGSIQTSLGKPQAENGQLELRGGETVKVSYVDSHTSDRQFDRPVLKEIQVVGNAVVRVTDGAYSEALQGIVLEKGVNIEIIDADFDLTDEADELTAMVELYREKTPEEIDQEVAAIAAGRQPDGTAPADQPLSEELNAEEEIERFKLIDRVEVKLVEVRVQRDAPTLPAEEGDADPSAVPAVPAVQAQAAPVAQDGKKAPVAKEEGEEASDEPVAASPTPASADDKSIHSGVFRAIIPLVRADEVVEGDDTLQAQPNDIVQINHVDELSMRAGTATVVAKARCLEGNLAGVRVTRAEISDQELHLQTQLKTADALTNIGSRYKEFGLKTNAQAKYEQALQMCESVSDDAQKLGGRLLEDTYVQLWRIYYEMDNLDLAAAMCQRLQREFPESGFVDDALLQLADVARKQGDIQRAIGIYSRLVNMPTSQLRGDAQFGIAECYEQMAAAAPEGPGAAQLYDRAFNEYKRVFEAYPDSGRVGEAVSKMANYYYQQKDYARAIDTFETVLANHPDAKFLDVILFNYGRCLYRMERKGEARRQFDQLIAEFPESPLAADAKKISEALAKATAQP
ncbi:MAG: tetratricopeptide repeat protein [Pirellulales bacterium]